MKKFIFTESQIKKIIDSEIKETEEKKEFRPGVNLGKYDLKSFIGKKKEEDDEKESAREEVAAGRNVRRSAAPSKASRRSPASGRRSGRR